MSSMSGTISTVTDWWYSTNTHPRGASPKPWFRVEGATGFRADGHPHGESRLPCLRVVEGFAYPGMSLPSEDEPHFRIVGREVFLAGVVDGPWYRIAST
jgi:hypothetical protein